MAFTTITSGLRAASELYEAQIARTSLRDLWIKQSHDYLLPGTLVITAIADAIFFAMGCLGRTPSLQFQAGVLVGRFSIMFLLKDQDDTQSKNIIYSQALAVLQIATLALFARYGKPTMGYYFAAAETCAEMISRAIFVGLARLN